MDNHQGDDRHHSHADILKRLKRAEGHLRSTIGMIEGGRACVDIAQQLHAVEKAICSAKRTLIQDHIDHCLEHAAGSSGNVPSGVLDEFKQITKYI